MMATTAASARPAIEVLRDDRRRERGSASASGATPSKSSHGSAMVSHRAQS